MVIWLTLYVLLIISRRQSWSVIFIFINETLNASIWYKTTCIFVQKKLYNELNTNHTYLHINKGQSDQSSCVHVTPIRPFSLISNTNRLRCRRSSCKSFSRLARSLSFSCHFSDGSVPLSFALFNALNSLSISVYCCFFVSRNCISFLVSSLTLFRILSHLSPLGLEGVERFLWCWYSRSSMRERHLCCWCLR